MRLLLAFVFALGLGVAIALALQLGGLSDAAGRTVGASAAGAMATWIWINRRRLAGAPNERCPKE